MSDQPPSAGASVSADIPASLPPDLHAQLPHDTTSISALTLATQALPAPILNHSLRVYLLAKWLARQESSSWCHDDSLPLLFAACICHDLGATNLYNGTQRFEVEGADIASAHCATHGISEPDCHKVWTAIALHTSPGIAERIDPFTRLVRVAVKMDFSPAVRDRFAAGAYAAEIERLLPRLDVENVLANAVVTQASKISLEAKVDSMTWPDSEKHPKASWPGILLRAHLENPGYEGVNPAF